MHKGCALRAPQLTQPAVSVCTRYQNYRFRRLDRGVFPGRNAKESVPKLWQNSLEHFPGQPHAFANKEPYRSDAEQCHPFPESIGYLPANATDVAVSKAPSKEDNP
jgi:hypothetical protein